MVNASEDAENNGMVDCKYSCLKTAPQGFRRLANWLAETWRLNIGLLSPTSNNSKLPLCLFKRLRAQAYLGEHPFLCKNDTRTKQPIDDKQRENTIHT